MLHSAAAHLQYTRYVLRHLWNLKPQVLYVAHTWHLNLLYSFLFLQKLTNSLLLLSRSLTYHKYIFYLT